MNDSIVTMNFAAAYIVVLCSFAIKVSLVGNDNIFYHMETFHPIILVGIHATAYLLYPLLGWLSDINFTRYKVIRLAFIMMILAAIDCFLVALAILIDTSIVHDKLKFIILMAFGTPGVLLILISLGLFEANAIQFGMDQLLESSSDQLSSFIHWYY